MHPGEHGADGGAEADGPHLHLAAAGHPSGQVSKPVYSRVRCRFPCSRSPRRVTPVLPVLFEVFFYSFLSFRVTEEVSARLLKSASNPIERDGIVATRLCTHKDDVELTNENKLKQLPGVLEPSQAVHSDSFPLGVDVLMFQEVESIVRFQKYSPISRSAFRTLTCV